MTTRKNVSKRDSWVGNTGGIGGTPYTESDYNSNDGMLTTIWGPSQWHFLHTMSFNYPVNPTYKDKVNYRAYVLSLRNVLPCGKCRANLTVNFKKLPLKMSHMASRETFSKYVYDTKSRVSHMNKFAIHMRIFGRGVWYHQRRSKNVKRDVKRAEALNRKKVDVRDLSMAKRLNVFCALFRKKRRRQRLP